jgi:hypothetical protein
VATLIVHLLYHGDARFVVIGILAFGMGIQIRTPPYGNAVPPTWLPAS